MKRIHLLRVEDEAPAFADLTLAARRKGLRVGFLEWSPEQEPSTTPEAGWMRRVRLERGSATAWKPMAGPPVLHDVLREYFRGCVLVLVRSTSDLSDLTDVPRLSLGAEPTKLRIESSGDEPRARIFDVEELVGRLPRPRPFDD